MSNFRLFQTERVLILTEMTEFFKRIEHTVGKGEIAHHEQFLLFPQCFRKTCNADRACLGKGEVTCNLSSANAFNSALVKNFVVS